MLLGERSDDCRVAQLLHIHKVAVVLIEVTISALYELFASTLGHITDVVGIIYHKGTTNIPLTANN